RAPVARDPRRDRGPQADVGRVWRRAPGGAALRPGPRAPAGHGANHPGAGRPQRAGGRFGHLHQPVRAGRPAAEVSFAGIELTATGVAQAHAVVGAATLPARLADYCPAPVADPTAHRRIDIRRGNALDLPFEAGAFDLVFTRQALEQMDMIRRALARPDRAGGQVPCAAGRTLRRRQPRPAAPHLRGRQGLFLAAGGGAGRVRHCARLHQPGVPAKHPARHRAGRRRARRLTGLQWGRDWTPQPGRRSRAPLTLPPRAALGPSLSRKGRGRW
ncbi:MAG: class I SAM-dependent methyltransferase, partial [Alphaproteobacteria bacterium]|nr:class I SAM-dependent methyltransferase [Alphaproteobacteria bacterium]